MSAASEALEAALLAETNARAAVAEKTSALAVAEEALAAAMIIEAEGGASSGTARAARDAASNALEVAQAGWTHARALLQAAREAEERARQAALKEEYDNMLSQLENHPAIAAVDAVVDALQAFKDLRDSTRPVVHQYNSMCVRTGEPRINNVDNWAISLAGDKWYILHLMVEKNNNDQVGPQLSKH